MWIGNLIFIFLSSLLFSVFSLPVTTNNTAVNDVVPSLRQQYRIDLSHYGTRIYGFPSEETGKIVAEADLNKSNPEELGTYVEGDILVPRMAPKNGIIGEAYRWPKGKIAYDIAPGFDAKARSLIEQAISEYHKYTCIRFSRRTASDKDYLYFTNSNTGCWSSVGRIGGRQELNLQSPGCTSLVGTSIHEMMHAVGFMHEQNRHDRDGWIAVLNQNIRTGYEGNFAKMKPDQIDALGVQYDYDSVMHYNLQAFSKNGQPTMKPLKRSSGVDIGQRKRFSKLDIEKINRMYKCKGSMSGLDEPSGGLGSVVSGFFGLIGPDGIEDAEEIVRDQ